jgi:hypothetical protein
MDWVSHHLAGLTSVLLMGGVGGIEAKWRLISRVGRAMVAMSDCAWNRAVCEGRHRERDAADLLREREIVSLRKRMILLQTDVDRLVARSVESGVVSVAPEPKSAPAARPWTSAM